MLKCIEGGSADGTCTLTHEAGKKVAPRSVRSLVVKILDRLSPVRSRPAAVNEIAPV